MTDHAFEALVDDPRPRGFAERVRASPLLQLLGYVRPHARWAALTVGFGVLGFVLSFAYPWIIGSVVDLVTTPGPIAARAARLVTLTELAAITALLHAFVVYGRGHFNVHLGDSVVNDLRRKVFAHVQSLSLRFFASERTGAILGRVLDDVREAAQVIYVGVIVAVMDVVQLLIAVGFLVAISPKLTLACVCVFPLYALAFLRMNPRVRRASERLRAHLSQLSGTVAEQLAGQAVIKTFTAEKRETERFSRALREQHGLVVDQSHEGHVVAGTGEVLVHAGTTVVVGYGGWLALHGEMTAGTMTRFLGYILLMYGPVRRFAELNIVYQTSLSALRRVFRVLAIRPAVVERAHPVTTPPARGHVRIECVRFRYADDGDENARRPRVRRATRAAEPRRRVGAARRDARSEARRARRDRRALGRGQVDARVARATPLRRDRGARARRRRRRARLLARRAPRGDRDRAAGPVPLQRLDPRQHRLRAPRRDRRGDRGRGACRPRARVHRDPPWRLREPHRRARREPLRRPAPAPLESRAPS